MNTFAELAFYSSETPLRVAQIQNGCNMSTETSVVESFESVQAAEIQYAEIGAAAMQDGTVVVTPACWAEARTAQAKYPGVSRVGKSTNASALPVSELLDTFPDMNLFIKICTDETVSPLAEAIRQAGAGDRVSIGGASYGRSLATADKIGSSRTALTYGMRDGVRTLRASLTSVSLREYLKGQPNVQFMLPASEVSEEMIRQAHGLGKRVIIVANNRSDTKHALRKGADGVSSKLKHLRSKKSLKTLRKAA